MRATGFLEFFGRHCFIHKATIVSLLFISVVGLVSTTWFRGDFSIVAIDRLFPPDRSKFFIRGLYIWDIFQLGGANPRNLAGTIPYNIFLVLSEIAGLSVVGAEKLWFYLMFTSAGLSMYYLIMTMLKGKYRNPVGVTSALFYMFNPYVEIILVPQLWLFIIFLPLILAMYIKGLEEEKRLKYIFLISLIWTLTSASDYVNPKFAVFHWVPILMYLVSHVLMNRSRSEIKLSLRFTGMLLTVWTTLNAYWILPQAFNFKEIIGSPLLQYTVIATTRLESYRLSSAPLLEAMRLLGFWGLHSGYKGFPYSYWAPAYDAPIFMAIGFLIPLLAFACLLHKPKDKNALFFGLITVIGLFIMNGSNPPLGLINEYLVTRIPFAIDVFSSPYMFGGMYVSLGYAFLLGYTFQVFFNNESVHRVKKSSGAFEAGASKCITAGLILFLISGVYAFPLWTGDVIYPGNEVMASNRYDVPSYYYEARNWLDVSQGDFNILALPYSILGYNAYTWKPEGFNGPDPTELLLGKPVVAGLSGQGMGLSAAKSIVNSSSDKAAKTLSLMNIKYVLFHRDANFLFLNENSWYISTSLEQFQSILSSQEGLFLEKSFGELDFYRNEYWKPMHIYATTNSTLVNGGLSQISQIVERDDFRPGESVLLLSDQLDARQLSSINGLLTPNLTDRVSMTYEEINPTKYAVHVNSTNPFFLVFSESYHKDWVAYTEEQHMPDEYHFTANGFANAWYIGKTGIYTITLEFWPQKLFYIGSAISIITVIVCTTYTGRDRIKTIYRKITKKGREKILGAISA